MFDQTAIAKADALIFWYGLEGESTRAKYKHFLAVQELSTNIIWSFIYDCFWLCSCNTCCSREQRVSFVSIWLHPFSVLIMLENRVRTTVISLFWQQKITLLDMCNVQYTYLMCFCLGKSEWRIEDGLELFSICIDWFQRHCIVLATWRWINCRNCTRLRLQVSAKHQSWAESKLRAWDL